MTGAPPGHLEVGDANHGAKVSRVLEVSGLHTLEGIMEHTCPRSLPGPSTIALAMEVVMGKKAVCSGRRAGCALPMRGKEKLMERDKKPRSNSAGHPERESNREQASRSKLPRAHGTYGGQAGWWVGSRHPHAFIFCSSFSLGKGSRLARSLPR